MKPEYLKGVVFVVPQGVRAHNRENVKMTLQEPCVFIIPPKVSFTAADIIHTVKKRSFINHAPVRGADGIVILKKAELVIHANLSPSNHSCPLNCTVILSGFFVSVNVLLTIPAEKDISFIS
jgi:hypothetical protein